MILRCSHCKCTRFLMFVARSSLWNSKEHVSWVCVCVCVWIFCFAFIQRRFVFSFFYFMSTFMTLMECRTSNGMQIFFVFETTKKLCTEYSFQYERITSNNNKNFENGFFCSFVVQPQPIYTNDETKWSVFVWREIFHEKFVHLLFAGISKPNNSFLFIHLYPFHVNDSRQFCFRVKRAEGMKEKGKKKKQQLNKKWQRKWMRLGVMQTIEQHPKITTIFMNGRKRREMAPENLSDIIEPNDNW